MLGSTFLGRLRAKIMHQITMGKWREHVLVVMNSRQKFDLSGVNFLLPIDSLVDKSVEEKRLSFYKFQLDILWKTAED